MRIPSIAPAKRPKFGKNPSVDTSFLPDREREEEERREREELRKEWLRKQEEMKKEDIEITYSYWDGSGHRKSVMVCVYYSLILLHVAHSPSA
jgi:protein FAM50